MHTGFYVIPGMHICCPSPYPQCLGFAPFHCLMYLHPVLCANFFPLVMSNYPELQKTYKEIIYQKGGEITCIVNLAYQHTPIE